MFPAFACPYRFWPNSQHAFIWWYLKWWQTQNTIFQLFPLLVSPRFPPLSCLWRQGALRMLWGQMMEPDTMWLLGHTNTQRQFRYFLKTLVSVFLPPQVVLNLIRGQVSMLLSKQIRHENGLEKCKCLRNQVSFLWWHECLCQIWVWMQSCWCLWWKRWDWSATDLFFWTLLYPQLCLTTNQDILSNAVTIIMSPLR